MRIVVGVVAITVASALAACGGGDDSFPVAQACNPLGVNHCLTPWPSSAFEAADASTATGRRLAIPPGALPTNADGIAADPAGWNTADGFSPSAPLVMSFPGGVSAAGLPGNDNYDASLGPDSATVILDLTTGARVAHFAELDVQASATPDSQALYLRPAARLVGGHRYAAAITKKVKAASGDELPIPPGFAALRDQTMTDHRLLEAMRPRFADVLTSLATAGFPADDLVVAWDFTVASDDSLHRDMVAVRDRGLVALASHTIAFTVKTDLMLDDSGAATRRITGTFDAPLFLSNQGKFVAGTTIVRGADRLPLVQGFYQIPFTAIVPQCALTATAPVPMVMYGHGLLGDSGETAGGVQRTTARELCVVFVGTDMRGMSTPDLPAVATALNEVSHADEVMEVLEQGLANHVALAQAMRTTFATQLFVTGTGASARSLVDPQRVYYYGLSQGAIMGTAVMAYEPTITRAALGAGAANYSLLLERSTDWLEYRTILIGAYPDALDVTLNINLFQMRWDKVEGAGVVNSVLAGTATGTPPKQLLMQMAIGDDEVANIGTYWEVRSMGAPLLAPSPLAPWGIPLQTTPLANGSALVIMDGGVPAPPATNVAAAALDMHDLTRNSPAARRQIGAFWATGQIIDECANAGPCTCQTGSCN